MRKMFAVVFALLMVVFLSMTNEAKANENAGYIYWGEIKNGVYSDLYPYTLNWSGDVLEKGGLTLSDLKSTSQSGEADIVINQYGSIGARSLVKLEGETLEEPSTLFQYGSLNSFTFASGDLFLLTLHDGKHAKIRIDRVLPKQVSFSYVLEADPPAEPSAPAAVEHPVVQPKASPVSPNSPFSMTLQIGSSQATVNGQSKNMSVPPTVVNGNTLVPIRFVAEALGADVKWDGTDRKISLVLNNKSIYLWIDSSHAVVDGNKIDLEAPAAIIKGTTVVPIRFVSENFEQKVQYDAKTQKIMISGTMGSSNGSQETQVGTDNFPSSLFGTWETYSNNDDTKQVTGGISIDPDGTFVQRRKLDSEVTGVWRTAKPGEVKKYSNALILQSGLDKADWAIVLGENGTIEILQSYLESAGGLYGGRKIGWLESSVGTILSNNPEDIEKIAMTDYDYNVFQGKWSLWIEGGATNYYYKDTGNYATHTYTPGADGGSLTVNADGTYTITGTEEASGTWRPSKFNEVYGYNWSIILEDGPDGIDWTVLINASGKTMVSYDSGDTWSDGSRMWLPMYVANRLEE